MKSRFIKFLSLSLALIMLLSAAPISASAADPISLSKNNELVKIVAPTITPTEFDYGLTYGDLTVSGGEVWYDGEKVDGYFGFSRSTGVPNPGEAVSPMLYFYPTDTTRFKKTSYLSTASSPIENWPVLKINTLDAEISGEVTATPVDPHTVLSAIPVNGKVINSKTKEEVTTGKWEFFTDDEQEAYREILENGTYRAKWTAKGYNDLFATVDVVINDTGTPPTGIAVYPKADDDNIVYSAELTFKDIKLVGGKAIYLGKEVEGTFEWYNPDGKLPGLNVGAHAKFVPADESLAQYFSKTFSMSYSIKGMPIGMTKNPDELVLPVGYSEKSILATDVGFEFEEGVDTSKIMVKWTLTVANMKLGEKGTRVVTLYVDGNNYYESHYWNEYPVRIVNAEPLPVTKIPEEIKITARSRDKSMAAVDAGFEFGEAIDASKVMLQWEGDYSNLPGGLNDAKAFTLYYDDTYEKVELNIPVRVVPVKDNGKFCFIDLTSTNSNNEGKVNIRFSYHSQYKTGTATIKLNDIVMAENVPPTYSPSESSKTAFYQYTIPEPGTYTFVATAEYFPGEGDSVEFTNPVVESHPLTITVKPWRTLTLVNAKTESFETYEGKELSISTSLKTDDFKCWEFTDANGNVISPETFGLTAEDMEKTTLAFKMIDKDITLTAKEKKLIDIPTVPDNPGDGNDDNGELTFWQRIVNFFTGIFEGICNSDCILVNWIGKLWKLIVGAFTAVINLITGK